jgi:glucokinase
VTSEPAALGIDVGGQSIKAVSVSADGEVLAQDTVRTGAEMGPDAFADAVASLRDTLAPKPAVAIGVGVAGVLDRSGTLRGAPHLPLLVGCNIQELLVHRLACGIAVHNDADCAAMAEGWKGAADGCDDFLAIIIGTGVGSGLVLGGRLRAGSSGYGCEFGHMMVVHEGRLCGCGNRGCLEAYVSETAVRRFVEEAGASLQAAVAHRRGTETTGFSRALFELADSGDAEAQSITSHMVDVLGAAIGSAVNVLDLTTIVIGGGIAPGVIARMPRLRNAAASTLFARDISTLEIVAASRGPLAGAIGAARLGIMSR